MKSILNDPQLDAILSNFPSSKDYGLLLTCIVLRGPSSHGITHDLFSKSLLKFLSLLKFTILYEKSCCTRVITVSRRPRPHRSHALRRLRP